MAKMNDGGAAFPVLDQKYGYEGEASGLECTDQGMTLRDWFAGQALAGIAYEYFGNEPNTGSAKADMRQIAHCAYLCADFMLEKRTEEP